MYAFSRTNCVRKLGHCLYYYCCCSSDGSELRLTKYQEESSTADKPRLITKYGELAVLGWVSFVHVLRFVSIIAYG